MTALDNKTQIDAILLDFAKPFDKVPHKRLLYKLTSYGITGNTHNWITSFLSNRKQRVPVNGALSDITDVTYTLLAVHQRHKRKRSIECPPICR